MKATSAILVLGASSALAAPHKSSGSILSALSNIPLGPWSNAEADGSVRLIDHFVDPTKEGQLVIGKTRKDSMRSRVKRMTDDVIDVEASGSSFPQGRPDDYEVTSSVPWSDGVQVSKDLKAGSNALRPREVSTADLELISNRVEDAVTLHDGEEYTYEVDVAPESSESLVDRSLNELDHLLAGVEVTEYGADDGAGYYWRRNDEEFDDGQSMTGPPRELDDDDIPEDRNMKDEEVADGGETMMKRDFYVWEGSDELSDMTDVPFW